MLKKALKISIIISILGIGILAGAMFLTKSVKKEIKKAKTTVPDKVEYISPKFISEKKMAEKVRKKLKKKGKVYSLEYQKAAKSVIDKLKKKDKYTLESPLLIVNPYGTNKTSLYIYFKHHLRVNTSYTVSVRSLDTENEINIPNFSENMYTNVSGLPLAEQEGQIIGLLSGVKNYVSVYLYDENKKMVAKSGYRIELPKEEGEVPERLAATHERELSQLSNGLFAVFGLSPDKEGEALPFYDNNGVLRARLMMEKGKKNSAVNIRFIDGKIFYAIDERRYALINSVGKVDKIYDLGKGYAAYGDFDFTPANRYMITFSKKGTQKHLLSVIDLYDGKSRELLDLDTFFPARNKNFDFTSLRIINDKDILISERNTSSVIRINNVFRRPEAKAVLSGEGGFSGEAFREINYQKEGEFISHVGQTAVFTDREKKPEKRTYQIQLLNNNKGRAPAVYYEYRLDEKNKTYRPEREIVLGEVAENGSISVVDKNLILSLGDAGVVYEYNSDNNLLATLRAEGERFYRVMKFDMKGSWFSK